MSDQVMEDLKKIGNQKPVILVRHPLYDNFGTPINKSAAREKLGLKPNERIILFFGFIRKYKGLDLLLEAMKDVRVRTMRVKLMIAGEFYGDHKPYDELIAQYGIEQQLIRRTDFIPDSEVRYYLCAADMVVQPYRQATQSGVTPLAYYFEKPMIVTNVGGLPALVPDGKAGLVAEPNAKSIAEAIIRFYEIGEDHFIPHLRAEKQKYSWTALVDSIKSMAFADRP
jgi:glycosyltransferase involved in cell wall biosynthesis